jgi:uncharacterized protein HemX
MFMMRRTPIVSSQHGRTALVVLSAVLGIGALALLFIYLPSYQADAEKEASRQAFEERKKNFEQQARELQQKQIQSRNEREARQRRLEQEREGQK